MMRGKAIVVAAAFTLGSWLTVEGAHAQSAPGVDAHRTRSPSNAAGADAEHRARESYEKGKAAYDLGDFREAARAFAAADEAKPNERVLELAIAAAVRAGDGEIGMPLVEAAESRGVTAAAQAGRAALAPLVGRLVVLCPLAMKCDAQLDGAPMKIGGPMWLRPGEHQVSLRADGVDEILPTTVVAGATQEVRPSRVVHIHDAPPTAAAAPIAPSVSPLVWAPIPEAPPPKHLAPAWFWGGVAATALVGVGTIVSGVDVANMHSEFAANPGNAALADSGRSAELRTNLLIGGTCLLAVATTVAAYFVFHQPFDRSATHAL